MEESMASKLQAFNKRIRSVHSSELSLGGKRLPIDAIYKTVIELGGFDKVTAEKKWRVVGDHFNLPITCTNSAYVLKQFYVRNCWNYERVMLYNAAIEDLTIEIEVPEPEIKDTPKQEEVRLPRAPTQQSYVRAPVAPAPVAQPQDFSKLDKDKQDLKYIYGAHKSRISLCLQSGLKNEIEWAMSKLVSISFVCPDNFHIGAVPEMLTHLLQALNELFGMLDLNLSETNFETTVKEEFSLLCISDSSLLNNFDMNQILDRANQVLHILRNFSFLEQNAILLADTQSFIVILAKGIALPQSTQFIKVKQHCVDIAENLSPFIQLTGQTDFFLICFKSFIFLNDRSLILASVRTITRFMSNKTNHALLQTIDAATVERMCNLLLLADEEIVSSILEYFYQYTSLNKQKPLLLAESSPRNIVKFLCKFLHWKNHPQPLAFPQASGAHQLRGPDTLIPKKKFIVKQETRTIVQKQTSYPTHPTQGPGYPLAYPQFGFGMHPQMQQMQMMGMQGTPMQMYRPSPMQATLQQRGQVPQIYQTPGMQINPGITMMQTQSMPTLTREASSTPPNGVAVAVVSDAMDVDKSDAVSDKTNPIVAQVADTQVDMKVNDSPRQKRKIDFKEPSPSFESSDDFKSSENQSLEASNSNETNASYQEPQKAVKTTSPPRQQPQQQFVAPGQLNRHSFTPAQMQQMQQMQQLQQMQHMQQVKMMMTPGAYPYGYTPQPQAPFNYPPQTRTITEDVKYEVGEEDVLTYGCRWNECSVVCESEEQLVMHVREHIDTTEAHEGFICCWSGCTSTHRQFTSETIGLATIQQLVNHVNLHHPLRTKTMREVLKVHKEPAVVAKADGPGLSGIPLTALLVLRNMSVDMSLFLGCEDDLAVLMAVDARFSGFIGQILGE